MKRIKIEGSKILVKEKAGFSPFFDYIETILYREIRFRMYDNEFEL